MKYLINERLRSPDLTQEGPNFLGEERVFSQKLLGEGVTKDKLLFAF